MRGTRAVIDTRARRGSLDTGPGQQGHCLAPDSWQGFSGAYERGRQGPSAKVILTEERELAVLSLSFAYESEYPRIRRVVLHRVLACYAPDTTP